MNTSNDETLHSMKLSSDGAIRLDRLIHYVALIQRETILERSPNKALNRVLEALLELTESEYGFVGEVLKDPDGTPFLRSYAVTNIGWTEELREMYARYISTGLDFRNLGTLFGRVIVTGQPMLTADAPHHPHAHGVPNGHPPLNTFAGIPIFSEGRMVGMYGLANRKGGYTQELIDDLQPITDAAAMMMNGLRIVRDLEAARRQAGYSQSVRQAMIQKTREPLVITDAQGRITEFNPAAAALFGWKKDDVAGRLVWDVIAPDDRREQYARLFTAATTDATAPSLSARTREGGELLVEIAFTPLTDEQQPGMAAFFKDLTAESLAETTLRKVHAIQEEESRRKLSFIAIVSHEIRTPVATISGALEMLSRSSLDEDQRELLSSAVAARDALLELVDAVLDFSRLEAMELNLMPAPFSPDALLRSVVEQFRPMLATKGLYVKLQGLEALPRGLMLKGDAGRLRQILTNLIGNAAKFTAEGGITLQVIATPVPGGRMTFGVRVRDTGPGVPAEFRPHLFRSFSQADSSLSRARGGTGLGLAISQRLAALMRGRLWLEESDARGSVFALAVTLERVDDALPLTSSAGSATALDAADDDKPLAGTSVLVVDDNRLNLKLLRRQLESVGCTVASAESGFEALDILAALRPDVILMDLEMPGMSGLEATERYRQRERDAGLSRAPVIALTGHAAEEFRDRAQRSGCTGFLTKPFRLKELVAALVDARRAVM